MPGADRPLHRALNMGITMPHSLICETKKEEQRHTWAPAPLLELLRLKLFMDMRPKALGSTMPPGGGRGVMGGMLLPDDSISEPPFEPAEPLCEPMPAHARLQRSGVSPNIELHVLRPYAHTDVRTLRGIGDSHALPQLPVETGVLPASSSPCLYSLLR